MTPAQRSERVRNLAHQHGFELCRITRPEISDQHRQALLDWLRAGMHADMHWMAESSRLQRRLQPRSLLPGAASVIVLGMRYTPPPSPPSKTQQAYGIIAAYALGDDYHDVMKKRMRALCRALMEWMPEEAPEQRIYVDTAPILEHALAQSAGLGWIGKHSLSIDRVHGSWFLLGEIFTTAELAPDPIASAHCGSCTRCLDLCPTGAIVGPMQVDARRCIAWLTIEYKGTIPMALREPMGVRIYGCDDCQSCCPWNRHAKVVDDDALRPRKENEHPPLAELLALDEAGFRHRFRKSPIRRSGRIVLQRNCCIAAGNAGDASLIPLLRRLQNAEEEILREHANWALQRLETRRRSESIRYDKWRNTPSKHGQSPSLAIDKQSPETPELTSMRILGSTSVYGIIGHPVAHSLSPLFQNHWLRQTEVEACYVPFPVLAQHLGGALQGLHAAGVMGLNVTVPHKAAVCGQVEADEASRKIGAVNTLRRDVSGWQACNTDQVGIQAVLRGLQADLSQVLILGAGGTARAAVHALAEMGAEEVYIANRTAARAEELIQHMQRNYPSLRPRSLAWRTDAIRECSIGATLCIHCSSIGLHGEEEFPFDLQGEGVAMDAVYRKDGATPFCRMAARSRRVCDGLPMLIAQGAASFAWWHGHKPNVLSTLRWMEQQLRRPSCELPGWSLLEEKEVP